MLNKNQIVTLDVTDINNFGCGVGRVDGMVVFVKGAVSGDRVEAKIIKVNKSYSVGKLESIISPSEYRIKEEFCNAPNACGGCVYRHITYPHELEMKKKHVENAFRKVGLPEVKIDEVMSTGEMSCYRNKAQYPFGRIGDKTCVGFYANKTHKVIPCNICALQPQVFSDICDFVCNFADENKWSVYDEEKGVGLLRHLYIRMGKNTGEIMLCIVINGDYLTKEQEFSSALCDKFPSVKSVLININKKNTNVVLGKKYRTIRGRDYIEDVLLGKRFRISAGAFYQVNHDGAELLYSIAKQKAEEMGEIQTLLDLYCGIGTIGISIGDGAKRTVGIEIVDEAIACAKENAELNGVKHAQFYCGDAGDAEKLLDNAEKEGGIIANATVIVDPPRKGLEKELINYLSKREMDRIVYVSCDPDTLARDCVIFKELGYTIGRVTPVDMFPRTGHVETVVCLSRQNDVHKMKLNAVPFEMIMSGEKTIELRLYDEKRKQIKVGDKIVFTNTTTTETLNATVIKLHRFATFDDLYKSLPLLKCGYTTEDINTAHPSDMEQYYSVEEQRKYGVVGIELCRPKQITDECVVSIKDC